MNISSLQTNLPFCLNINSLDIASHEECQWQEVEIALKQAELTSDLSYKKQYNPLTLAVKLKNLDLCQTLTRKGADIDAKDNSGNRALELAIKSGEEKIAKHLIESGANVSISLFDGATLLHIAALYGQIDIMELLVEKGLDINSIGIVPSDVDSLMLSYSGISSDYQNLVRERLKEKGFQLTPLVMAITNNQSEAVQWLISRKAILNKLDLFGRPIFHALTSGNAEIVKLLIDSGIDILELQIKYLGEEQAPLIHLLTCSKNSQALQLYFAHKGNPNKVDSEGNTALHGAVLQDDVEVISVLLKAGANVNQRNNRGETPIHGAIFLKKADILSLLLQKEANLNEPMRENGNSYLHDAVQTENNGKSVSLLLAAGADVNQCNKKGHSSIYYAILLKRADILSLLFEAPSTQA